MAQSVYEMVSFGKKLREQREKKGFSQSQLAKEVGVHQSIIGRYERDEAKPTIDVVKRMSQSLATTVGYLLGEIEDSNLFESSSMLNRLKELNALPEKDKEHILYTLDALLRDAKTRQAYL